jgi:exocyst complex component 8
MFRTQVYGNDMDSKTVDEALRITYSQSKKVTMFPCLNCSFLPFPQLLQDYGLDFRFILHSLLKSKTLEVPPLEVPIPSPTLILDIARMSELDVSPTSPPAPEALLSPPLRSRTPISRSRPPILLDPMPASDKDGLSSPVAVRRARTPPVAADVTERPRLWIGPAPPPRSNQRPTRAPPAGSSNLRKDGAF